MAFRYVASFALLADKTFEIEATSWDIDQLCSVWNLRNFSIGLKTFCKTFKHQLVGYIEYSLGSSHQNYRISMEYANNGLNYSLVDRFRVNTKPSLDSSKSDSSLNPIHYALINIAEYKHGIDFH